MPKFFFDAEHLNGDFIDLNGKTAHHIVNVLRYKKGDKILLCDGNCIDYVSRLVSYETHKKSVKARFEVLEARKCLNELPFFVRLFQSVIKWDNLNFAIQKSVEVGVSEIVPLVAERSNYGISDVKKKVGRMNQIAKSAAEQSKRGIVPRVTEPINMDCFASLAMTEGEVHAMTKGEVLAMTKGEVHAMTTVHETQAFFACCDESVSLVSRLENIKFDKVDLWIGPEGGFTDYEKKSMKESSIIPFNLGPRVLRSETASIVSIASLALFCQR